MLILILHVSRLRRPSGILEGWPCVKTACRGGRRRALISHVVSALRRDDLISAHV